MIFPLGVGCFIAYLSSHFIRIFFLWDYKKTDDDKKMKPYLNSWHLIFFMLLHPLFWRCCCSLCLPTLFSFYVLFVDLPIFPAKTTISHLSSIIKWFDFTISQRMKGLYSKARNEIEEIRATKLFAYNTILNL